MRELMKSKLLILASFILKKCNLSLFFLKFTALMKASLELSYDPWEQSQRIKFNKGDPDVLQNQSPKLGPLYLTETEPEL